MVFQHPTDNPIKERFTGVDAEEIANWQVNFKDKFDLSYLYKAFHDWLVDEGWAPVDEWEFPEIHYIHKESPHGTESRIRWRLKKEPDPNYHGLFEYWMDLDFAFFGMQDAELVYKGKKIKVKKGGFELIVKAFLIIDKEKAWGKGLLKQFKETFYKRMIRQQYLKHQDTLYEETFRLRDFTMRFAKLGPPWVGEEGAEYYRRKDIQ